MVFSSLYFIFVFFPLVCLVYYLFKLIFPSKIQIRNCFLLLASLFFYAWGEPVYVFIMMFSIIVNYFCSLLFNKIPKSKVILIICIVFNLSFLFFFKYSAFALSNINVIFKTKFTVPDFSLPIGISFYTFQALSYIIDVYRKKVEPQKNILNLALYISLFPQLIAGPIVRYIDIQNEIVNRKETLENFTAGLIKFMTGLGAKVIIANNLAVFADGILNQGRDAFSLIPGGVVWLSCISYAFQIYFDFFGYSLMAIGLGKMFGFSFPDNFNSPYCAASVTDFWRRWHITLSSWFRDYVYIPLGGNRCKPLRHIINLLVTWTLTGFWHGASWNFIIWGFYYAVLLIFEKYIISKIKMNSLVKNSLYRFITLFIILFGWIIFRSENLLQIGMILKGMFYGSQGNISFINYISEHADVCSKMIFIIPALLCSFPLNKVSVFKNKNTRSQIIQIIFALIIFIVSVFMLVASTYNPFIYFRF